jgi:hypothetical protein
MGVDLYAGTRPVRISQASSHRVGQGTRPDGAESAAQDASFSKSVLSDHSKDSPGGRAHVGGTQSPGLVVHQAAGLNSGHQPRQHSPKAFVTHLMHDP